MSAVLRLVSVAVSVVLIGQVGSARAQCPGTPLCPPGDAPCVIAEGATCSVPAGVYDLGTRALNVFGTLEFSGAPVTVLTAGDVTVGPRGTLRAVEGGSSAPGGRLRVLAAGAVAIQSAGTAGGVIDVSGPGGGGALEVIAGGAVRADGRILASGRNRDRNAGIVILRARGGDLVVGDPGIEAIAGGSEGSGGAVQLVSESGSVVVQSRVTVARGYCGACEIAIEAARDIRIAGRSATLDVRSTTGSGDDGGFVDLAAGGVVDVAAPITANGSGEFGGGGSVTMTATGGGDITLSGDVSVNGSNGGDGGIVIVTTAGTIRVSGRITLQGEGPESGGGDATIGDLGTLLLPASVVVSGSVEAPGAISGGEIDVAARGAVDVSGRLRANSGTNDGGGYVNVLGCAVELAQNGVVEALGGGATLLQAGGSLAVRGRIRSRPSGAPLTVGTNTLQTREGRPTVAPTAVIDPPPEIEQNPTLPCCTEACAPPDTTTTTTVTSTTTTEPQPTTTTTNTTGTTSTTTSTTSTTTSTSTTSTTTTSTITSTTTTDAPVSSTTTVTVSTSTSSTLAPVTTTTAPPPAEPCADLPSAGFDAVECRLDLVRGVVTQEPDASLGGARSANRFRAQLERARRAVGRAKAGKRVLPSIRLARKQLRAFDRGITVAERRGMPADVGVRLRTLVQRVGNDLALIARSR